MYPLSLKLVKSFLWQRLVLNQALYVREKIRAFAVWGKAVCLRSKCAHILRNAVIFLLRLMTLHFTLENLALDRWCLYKQFFCLFVFLRITIDPVHSQFSNSLSWVNCFQQTKFSWYFFYSIEIWQINSS